MGVTLGSARISENGTIYGTAGDQTGSEVAMEPFYMHQLGWFRLRPKTTEMANSMAEAMIEACNNNHIGYSQGSRYGAYNALKTYGTLKRISENVNCDCSALVRACHYQATGKDCGDIYTGNLADALEYSGLYEKRAVVRSEADVMNGDVLVTRSTGHTVIVVSGAPREEEKKDVVADKLKTLKITKRLDGATRYVNVPKTWTMKVHVAPSSDAPLLQPWGQLNRGDGVQVFAKTADNWALVSIADTQVGWVGAKYLSKTPVK